MTTPQPTEKKYWLKVKKSNTCWFWLGNKNTKGYGMFWSNGKNYVAHRYSYEREKGPIPKNLVLDHLCRVHDCVNPNHLEIVTPKENVLRGIGLCAINSRKTKCNRGHELEEINLIRTKKGRECLACKRMRQLKYERTSRRKPRV